MFGKLDDDIPEDIVHHLPITFERNLVGGCEDLVDEGVGKLHKCHLRESLDKEVARSCDLGDDVGEVPPTERNEILLVVVLRHKASQLIDHPLKSIIQIKKANLKSTHPDYNIFMPQQSKEESNHQTALLFIACT